MQNNNMNKVVPEPLLFIHTVCSPISSNGSQRYYDSRFPERSKIQKAELDFSNREAIINESDDDLLIKKIKNIVKMYSLNHPINTMIETINNESIEGIPFKIEEDHLFIKQASNDIRIPLSIIKDAVILKI